MVKNKLQASTRAAREEMFHGMEENLGLGGLAGSLMGLAASLNSPRGRAFMGVMLLVFVLLVTEMELGIFVQHGSSKRTSVQPGVGRARSAPRRSGSFSSDELVADAASANGCPPGAFCLGSTGSSPAGLGPGLLPSINAAPVATGLASMNTATQPPPNQPAVDAFNALRTAEPEPEPVKAAPRPSLFAAFKAPAKKEKAKGSADAPKKVAKGAAKTAKDKEREARETARELEQARKEAEAAKAELEREQRRRAEQQARIKAREERAARMYKNAKNHMRVAKNPHLYPQWGG